MPNLAAISSMGSIFERRAISMSGGSVRAESDMDGGAVVSG